MAFNLINFKKGTLAGLETLKTNNGIEEGTFYLTIDNQKQTSRLFIGTSSSTALPVNSNISIVTNASDLEASGAATPFNDGDFAYVSNGNILAVKIGNAWHQINAPDSRAIRSLTPEISTTSGTATIEWKLRDQTGNVIPEADPSDNTHQSVIANSVPNITVSGANGVAVSNTGKAITVTGTSYEMTSPAVVTDSNTAIIKLQSKVDANPNTTAVEVSSISISGGSNVTITGDNANNFTIAAADTTLNTTQATTIANNATAGFDITVKDTLNNGNTETLNPKITLGTHTAAADEIKFVNGVANLPVYTKNEIDQMNRDLNALVYRGTVGGNNASFAQEVSAIGGTGLEVGVGDTFKLLGDSTSSYSVPGPNNTPFTAHGGDLIIANSSATPAETNGSIPKASLYFDVVPSGDEKFEFKGLGTGGTGNGIQIEDGNATVLSSIEIKQGNQIAVSSTHTGTNGEKAVVSVAHGPISVSTTGDANVIAQNATPDITQSNHAPQTFDVVTGLTTDNGHVTGTTVQRIKVVDTVSKIDVSSGGTALTVSAPASGQTDYNKAATVTSSIKLVDEDGTVVPNSSSQNVTDLAFTLRSDNLQITTSGSTITANYVWGTF